MRIWQGSEALLLLRAIHEVSPSRITPATCQIISGLHMVVTKW